MLAELQYVAVTHFNTILCTSEGGCLYHIHEEEVRDNYAIIGAYGIFTKNNNKIKESKIIGDDYDNGIFIITKEGYLSSLPGGAVELRDQYAAWECFRLIPVEIFLKEKKKLSFILIKKKRKFHISNLIHQIGNAPTVNEIFQSNVEKMKNLNPGWTYMYWDEKSRYDFIYEYFGWDILKYYLKINPKYGAARADFFRYLCIYQLGGVYLDLKSGCSVPFDRIIRPTDRYILSQWNNKKGERFEGWGLGPEINYIKGGEYQQWHIMAAAGHPFLENVINLMIERIHNYTEKFFGNGRLSVLRVTGPYVYSAAIYPEISNDECRFIDAEKEGIIYSCVDNHTHAFGAHYSQLAMPLIL